MRSRALRSVAWASVLALGLPWPVQAEVTFRGRAETSHWPAGTDAIPFELRHGLIHFRATLRSPSGRDTSGFLVLDTGAPGLGLIRSVHAYLRLDTLERTSMSRVIHRWRPLASLELGRRTRLTDLEVQGDVPDTLLGPDVLGIFGPDLLQEKGMLLDYQRQRWVVVPRRPAIVHRDSTQGVAGDLGQRTRIQRSRSAFAYALGPNAVAVPVRMHEGGRILVRAHLEDARDAWRSPPLTLLVDTGASACGVFADVMDRHALRVRKWPWLRDILVHTVLGRFTTDLTLVPRVTLPEAALPIGLDRVETVADPRHILPDIEAEVGVPVHGLLGYTFLGRYRVLHDALQGVLWLEGVRDTTSLRLRHSHVGIQLERRWGHLRVAAVSQGSPADRAEIAVGDIIVSIGERSVATMEPERVEELLRGPPGTEVILVVRRDSGERVLRLKREQLL